MDLGLANKVAIVTGASAGLGEAIARSFAAEGANLVICARRAERLAQIKKELVAKHGVSVLDVAADLADPATPERVVNMAQQQFGRIDILVNNTGGPPAARFEDTTDEMWQHAVDLMLKSAVAMTHAVLPGMKQRNWGRVINVTSIAVKQPVDNLILSNSVRAGVTGFARTLANEVAKHGVTVNNVLPGFTRTERVEYLAKKTADETGTSAEDVVKKWERDIPMGRLAEPREFADAVVFLASERASYITGVSLTVDGGWVKSLI